MGKKPVDHSGQQDIVRIVDENLRYGFAQVPRPVLKAKGLSLKAKAVYIALLDYAWQTGSCFPGQQRLADDLDISIDTVQRALDELRKYQLVDWERQGLNKPNIYYLLRLSDNPHLALTDPGNRNLRYQETAKSGHLETATLRHEEYSEEIDSDRNIQLSNIRKRSTGKKRQQGDETSRGASLHRAGASHTEPSPLAEDEPTSSSLIEMSPDPEGTTRSEAQNGETPAIVWQPRNRGESKARGNGLSSVGDLLAGRIAKDGSTTPPQPQKRSSEDRQVILEYITDFARELGDNATLSSSVQRAYNLYQRSGLTIGSFTSLM